MRCVPFESAGGFAQERYERLRAYMLTERAARSRISPAQFDLRRFHRFGLLGLVEHEVLRAPGEDYEVEVIPVGAEDAEDRLNRLCALLVGWVTNGGGGEDAESGVVCPGLDRPAGEGADDPEPARRRRASG